MFCDSCRRIGCGYWGPNVARNFNAADGAKVIGCSIDIINVSFYPLEVVREKRFSPSDEYAADHEFLEVH
jgi:hypothetical protein